jgi:hypothetical protein
MYITARCSGDSLRSASARGKWSCLVATAALSTYSLTRIALPRGENRATLPSFCRSLTRWSTCQLDLPACKLSSLQRDFRPLGRYSSVATGWIVRWSNPGGGEVFPARPNRPRGLPNLIHNWYRVSFLGVKRPVGGPPSSAEVKEKVDLYLYSPFGPSCSVIGRALPLHLPSTFLSLLSEPRIKRLKANIWFKRSLIGNIHKLVFRDTDIFYLVLALYRLFFIVTH